MAILNMPQILVLGRRHGFSDAELPDWAAVVITESGGDTRAVQPGGLGRGIVQIDLGQHPDVTEAQAFDPDFAAAFARRLSRNGNGLGPPNWYGPRDHPEEAEEARKAARRLLGATGGNSLSGIPLEAFTGPSVGDAAAWVGDKTAEAVLAGIRALFPASLVRRVLLLGAGAAMVVVGATALGADVLKGPSSAVAKVTKAVVK